MKHTAWNWENKPYLACQELFIQTCPFETETVVSAHAMQLMLFVKNLYEDEEI